MKLTYSDPVTAVLLRRLAWECYVAKKPVTVKEVVTSYVQLARSDLGLAPYQSRSTSGGADAFIQGLQRNNLLPPPHSGKMEPQEQGWKDEWRLLYLPPHDAVRQLSVDPVRANQSSTKSANFNITLRNPAVPSLDVYIGKGKAGGAFPKRRGLYFIGREDGLYIGSTSEFGVRSRQHANISESAWYVFMSPAGSTSLHGSSEDVTPGEENSVTLDALLAAEGMLISFWNEVCTVLNDNRSSDRKPASPYLQQAIMLVMGVSAAFIWLLREGEALGLPITLDAHFKPSDKRGWPECYVTYNITKSR